MDDQASLPVRIFLRPVGAPLTIGMSGLAIASIVISGSDLGWVSPDQRHEIGYLIMTVPFGLQLIACLFAYLSRDGAAGAALGVLSLTWFGMGLTDVTTHAGSRSGALGLLLLGAAGVLFLSSIAVMLPKPFPGTVFGLAAVRFAVMGIYLLGAGHSWLHAAGIIGLVVAGFAGYGVLAFELEGQQHRPVIPTFRRGRGREALLGDPGQQLDQPTSEAGVRQTS